MLHCDEILPWNKASKHCFFLLCFFKASKPCNTLSLTLIIAERERDSIWDSKTDVDLSGYSTIAAGTFLLWCKRQLLEVGSRLLVLRCFLHHSGLRFRACPSPLRLLTAENDSLWLDTTAACHQWHYANCVAQPGPRWKAATGKTNPQLLWSHLVYNTAKKYRQTNTESGMVKRYWYEARCQDEITRMHQMETRGSRIAIVLSSKQQPVQVSYTWWYLDDMLGTHLAFLPMSIDNTIMGVCVCVCDCQHAVGAISLSLDRPCSDRGWVNIQI